MSKKLFFRLVVLVAAMMCALGASAQEAYAVYTADNTTFTFYYDNERSSRPGTTYDLNTGHNNTGWETDGTNYDVTKVVFDPSFADARPTSTFCWFYNMESLETIEGIEYLNTSEVTIMGYMFHGCIALTYLDLSTFNTSKVTEMNDMFYDCIRLNSVYVGEGWTTEAVENSMHMLHYVLSLVGGQGTTYNESNPKDKTYARIDGGPSKPGYFCEAKAYACYTPENNTLSFYYDRQLEIRQGTTYNLNTGDANPEWYVNGISRNVKKVVFDHSFADARPTSTNGWFYGMYNLESIEGMEYLNTSEVTDMAWMFGLCNKLTSIDLSHFNTAKVTNMYAMFADCWELTSLDLSSFNTAKVTDMARMFYGRNKLQTIYAGEGWSTDAVTSSEGMFDKCMSLVGGQGTAWNTSNPTDKTYAHIDGGPSNPGYFTEKPAFIRGDVNGDSNVNISDVTALINYLLSHDATGINLEAANCNEDSTINISDVTALINYLLSHSW